MKILFALTIGLMLGLSSAIAGSATWLTSPGTGDWNTAGNWTPGGPPNGMPDTATFQTSNVSAVSISANTQVDGVVFSGGATTAYTITVNPAVTLSISGAGISDNSGIAQNFVTAVDGSGNRGILQFRNSSTAGVGIFTNNRSVIGEARGGITIFYDTSTGGDGIFVNYGGSFPQTPTSFSGGGITIFLNSSTAGNATFITNGGVVSGALGGYTQFENNSTAGTGTFTNNGGTANSALGGQIQFSGNSSAGNGSFTTNGGTTSGAGGGATEFAFSATADHATFTTNGGLVSGADGGRTEFNNDSSGGNGTFLANGALVSGAIGGVTLFFSTSTAGNAKLVANGGVGGNGGSIQFNENSTGGTGQVTVLGNGNLDISGHSIPGVTIGSIDGDGNVFLGGNNLTVGSRNDSTSFSGVIQDSGSITKIGAGTLTLSGANTYTGPTTISDGKLIVDGSIMSAVTVNNGGALAGSGITGSVTLNSGGFVAPSGSQTLHINGNYAQNDGGELKIEVAGADPNASGHLNITGGATLDGTLEVRFVNGFLPAGGQVFRLFDVAGTFTGSFAQIIFPDLRAGFQFQVEFVNGSYQITALNDGVAAAGFLNMSTRMRVGTGDNALIGGFIVTGNPSSTSSGPSGASKKVIIRAIGPSLAPLPGRLTDPTLELRDSAGGLIFSNDNWRDSPQVQVIIDSTIPPSDDHEAAIVATLSPGSYTTVMGGAGNTTGIGVVEVYDLATDVSAKLANISSRGFVETGDNVMIGGFIAGNQAMHVMVRAIGPSLAQSGLANALADPTLTLHNAQGVIIAFNNDWRDTEQVAIEGTGIPPIDNKESAILATLAPGPYTAIVRGLNDTTGVGLVEVYNLQ